MFKSKCYQGGNRHKFEPRFTEEPNSSLYEGHMKAKGFGLDELQTLLSLKVYLFDICEWCGKKIKEEN